MVIPNEGTLRAIIMDMDELRQLGQTSANKSKPALGRDQMITIGTFAFAAVSVGMLAFVYFTNGNALNQTVALSITAPKSAGKSDTTTVRVNKAAFKQNLVAVEKMAKDVMQLPDDTSAGKTPFDRALAHCRQIEVVKLKAMGKDGRLMNFGISFSAMGDGRRSKRMGRILTCISDKFLTNLCKAPFRENYSKLVSKYMESNIGGGRAIAIMQKHTAKMRSKKTPEQLEKLDRLTKRGKYAPGFQRVQLLFQFGYLQRQDFEGFFSSPKWLDEFKYEVTTNYCA